MVDYCSGATTKISDYNIGGVVRSIFEAFGVEMEDITLRGKLALDRAQQESLFTPFNFYRLPAQPAIGLVRFSRATASPQNYSIPAGAIVQRPRSATSPAVQFRTRLAATLTTGATYVDVSVEALIPGTTGNVDAAAITEIPSTIQGVEAVTNPGAFGTGRAEETDSDRKFRFQKYIASLSKATRGALEWAAVRSNPFVFEALAIEDPEVTCLVGDSLNLSAGSVAGTYTDRSATARDPDDAAFPIFVSPSGLQTAIFIGNIDLFDGVNIHLIVASSGITGVWEYWNGAAWATLAGTIDGSNGFTIDGNLTYPLPADWRTVEIPSVNGHRLFWLRYRVTATASPVIPQVNFLSLPPGRGYADLIAHDGTGQLPDTMKTDIVAGLEDVRACGIRAEVKAPILAVQDVVAEVTLDTVKVFDRAQTLADCRDAIYNFLQACRLGQDVPIAKLVQILMNVGDGAVVDAKVSTPTVDRVIAPRQILRAGNVTITEAPVP
ncbi:MAG: baseplate J/gp47 family protein [Candidatus Wallbacteria bacterium]|nr:baseplate J/gp47 family protein [Candidatus Wallbacteria bacterium]